MDPRAEPVPGPQADASSVSQADERPPRRLVIFADGTGNAFGLQASNVWRLYTALDKARAADAAPWQQVARYIPGVGTSSLGVIRMIDGATGFGVPSNVRKLYRFLCWNWRPGDEIWMFGFSRGAFTVRALSGMIMRQGLMPCKINDDIVSTAEMKRNSKGAWRAYREGTAPLLDPKTKGLRMSPTIALARGIRNAYIWTKRRLLGQMTHIDVQKAQKKEPARCPGQVKVRLMGLFDTVEAYGVPVEEIRLAIDRFLWPISFRNLECSEIVEEVRHALALDEERRTFFPMRFKQPSKTRIKEVWFAGVHSDIGGGYPDDAVSQDALLWMADEAEGLGLKFDAKAIAQYADSQTEYAPIHDSLSGWSAAYRYTPRPFEGGPEFGGNPVLHPSVVAKIRNGADGYSPIILAPPFDVASVGGKADTGQTAEPLPVALAPEMSAVQSLVFWRRAGSSALIAVLIALMVFPWVIETALALQMGPAYALPESGALQETFASVVPAIFHPWAKSFAARPLVFLPLMGAAILVYLFNGALRDRIKDRANTAWRNGKTTSGSVSRREGWLIKTGAALRSNQALSWLHDVFARIVAPLLLGLALAAALLKLVQVVSLAIVTASGVLCPAPEGNWVEVPTDGSTFVAPDEYSTSDRCWPLGVTVQRGQTYIVGIEEIEPFTDDGYPVPLEGFETNKRTFVLAKLFRRADASWFQPVVQIGRSAQAVIALEAIDCRKPSFLHVQDMVRTPFGIPAPPNSIGRRTEMRFHATEDGPVYLYVNDASFGVHDFYANNTGKARITIRAQAGQ